jgi:hypothetical protein
VPSSGLVDAEAQVWLNSEPDEGKLSCSVLLIFENRFPPIFAAQSYVNIKNRPLYAAHVNGRYFF